MNPKLSDAALVRSFNLEWSKSRRPFFVDNQRNTYLAFIEEIEISEAYPENEDLAIKLINLLKSKYNILI